MSRRTSITIETDTLVILRSKSAGWSWCADCAAQVHTLRPADLPQFALPQLSSFDPSPAQTSAATPGLHWIRAPDGALRICLNSLIASIQTPNRGFPPPRITRKEDQ
jgi:hypothetical protein